MVDVSDGELVEKVSRDVTDRWIDAIDFDRRLHFPDDAD